MDNREMARLFGLGRIAVGVGLFAVPSLAAASWVGRDAQTAGVRTFSRGFGARDAGLGIGLLAALEDKDDAAVRRFLLLGALADGGDLAGTIANWRRLPPFRRTLVAAGIVAFGGLGLWLSQEFA
ncbi:MAG: hypothetical protein JWP02_3820 [Acidimicrobiales bacterium]|nr:hypothetical protein [Acidimicrobiales bacterium]